MSQTFDRDLMRGSLELMVLSALSDGAKYGYLIQKRVREASGQMAKLPAGTLYPLLHRLEGDKLIRARWEKTGGRDRKWYELTAAGRRRLDRQAGQWRLLVQCVERMLSPGDDRLPQPA